MFQRLLNSRLAALRVSGGAWRWLRYVLGCAVGLVVWISLLDVPTPAAGPHPDGSWAEAYVYFAKHHFQAGRDYIFTCGPLGHFRQPAYDADLFWPVYVFQLSLAAALAFIFLRFAADQPGWRRKVLFCTASAAPALLLGTPPDAQLITAMVLAFVLTTRQHGRAAVWSITLFALLVAVLSMLSFIVLVFGVAAVGLLTIHLWIDHRYHQAWFAPAIFIALFLGCWWMAGQSFGNLPTYLQTSLDLTSGYTEAMAKTPSPWFLLSGLVVLLLLLLAWLPLDAGHWRSPRWRLLNLRQLPLATLVALAIFVSWKHAFVRADYAHVADIFVATLLLMFLVPALTWSNQPGMQVRMGSWIACGLISFVCILLAARGERLLSASALRQQMSNRIQYAFAPAWRKNALDLDRQRQTAQWKLPEIRTRVGGLPVDLISYEQGVLFLNKLNWKPRPVFQSYSAYTPALLAINANYFRSDQAPTFVIFKLQTIDGRLPTIDDGAALEEILWRYEPVLVEGSYLLLQRRPSTHPRQLEVAQQKVVRFGEDVRLDERAGDCQSVTLKLGLTWRGWLLKLLFQLPKIHLETRNADGQIGTYRLVPAMAEHGFLLNPLMLNDADVLEYFGPRRGQRVVSFQVSGTPSGCYKDDIQVTVTNYAKPGKTQALSPAGEQLVRSSYANTQTQLGRAALGSGQAAKAIEHLQEALRLAPDLAEAHLYLGQAWQRQEKLEQATQAFQEALRLKPDFADAHVNLGLALQQTGKTDEAIRHFQEALRKKPDDSDAHSYLGYAFQMRGQVDEAILHCRAALRVNPNSALAHYNLGKALKKQGNLDEAIRHYQTALRLRPDLPEAHNDLGVALHTRGRVGEATASFRQALLLKPSFLEAQNNLGLALQSLGKYKEAITQFQMALRLKPEYPPTHRNLGLAYQSSGRIDDAMHHYREVIRLRPDHPEAYNNLAMILATSADSKLRDGKQAVTLAEKANQLSNGQDPGILDTLAAACAEAGDFPRAVQEQTLACSLAPEPKKAEYHARLDLYRAHKPLHQEPMK